MTTLLLIFQILFVAIGVCAFAGGAPAGLLFFVSGGIVSYWLGAWWPLFVWLLAGVLLRVFFGVGKGPQ
jgi:hypothetical protein